MLNKCDMFALQNLVVCSSEVTDTAKHYRIAMEERQKEYWISTCWTVSLIESLIWRHIPVTYKTIRHWWQIIYRMIWNVIDPNVWKRRVLACKHYLTKFKRWFTTNQRCRPKQEKLCRKRCTWRKQCTHIKWYYSVLSTILSQIWEKLAKCYPLNVSVTHLVGKKDKS